MILDDSTSSVDPETEKEIQESLKELMAGRTTIIVTQRMSMARLADRIILLSGGGSRPKENTVFFMIPTIITGSSMISS